MKLTKEQKGLIISHMLEYITQLDTSGKGQTYSRNRLAKEAGINIAYLDAMVNCFYNPGCEEYVFKSTVIKDTYFHKIARLIGYEIDNKYWRTFETDQYLTIENDFLFAKQGASVKSIIGSTGTGKTFGIEKMKDKYPAATFVVTCANDLNLRDLIRMVAIEVGVPVSENMGQSAIRMEVERKLRLWYDHDLNPILIFDEVENLKLAAWGRIKALYDNLKGYVAFMVAGTPDWYRKIKTMADTGKSTAPQIFSRFLSGNKATFLDECTTEDIGKMCQDVGVRNTHVINRICRSTRNYRDACDTLIALQRAAELENCEIDMDLYKREFKLTI